MKKQIRRTAMLGIMAALSAGTVISTAAPAQAWCFTTVSNPQVAHAYLCSSLDCGVTVLGDRLVTCP